MSSSDRQHPILNVLQGYPSATLYHKSSARLNFRAPQASVSGKDVANKEGDQVNENIIQQFLHEPDTTVEYTDLQKAEPGFNDFCTLFAKLAMNLLGNLERKLNNRHSEVDHWPGIL